LKKKISGLSYAYTDDGVELPVLDITHPIFVSSADEKVFNLLCKKTLHQAEIMKKLPFFVKNLIAKLAKTRNTYLSGMRTYILKLGPELIKGRKVEMWYRIGAEKFSAFAVRIRLINICKDQTEILMPQLTKFPEKDLCFINIAGGAATDSINALILIQKDNPGLLKGRKIEINVLEIDTYGPNFAIQAIKALVTPDGCLNGLDISINHIKYDWNKTENLEDILRERKDWIQICASEGGIFEYGTDDAIVKNLNSLYDNAVHELKISGSFLFDKSTVNPAILVGAEIMGVTMRFLGIEAFKSILKETNWILDKVSEVGSIYYTFTLKKDFFS
jgi:hypothetical protein